MDVRENVSCVHHIEIHAIALRTLGIGVVRRYSIFLAAFVANQFDFRFWLGCDHAAIIPCGRGKSIGISSLLSTGYILWIYFCISSPFSQLIRYNSDDPQEPSCATLVNPSALS